MIKLELKGLHGINKYASVFKILKARAIKFLCTMTSIEHS